MRDLIAESAEARAWIDRILATQSTHPIFGQFKSAVIWTDAVDDEGNLLVPVDPEHLALTINQRPFPLLVGHDPGRPVGKVLAAKVFKTDGGATFVAAALGFYQGAPRLGFRDVGVDALAPALAPVRLPALPEDFSIAISADPREIELPWLEELVRSAPVPVQIDTRSHNAAEAPHEFLSVGIGYVALVWNPFVTALATEAGKNAYAALNAWIRSLFERMAQRRNPILEIQSEQQGCVVSFMVRGKDVARHYKAHELLPEAAARAAGLISKLVNSGLPPVRLIYEFDSEAQIWAPAYAELSDGRLVTDRADLIAVEQLPVGLSLGLSGGQRVVT